MPNYYSNIGVIAPSGIFSPSRLDNSIEMLSNWGVSTHKSPNLYATHLFTAGTVKQRNADLNWAIKNNDIDLLWFARGGYGTVSTLANIVWDALNKPIIGFSDATAMLVNVYQHGGEAIHGPVLHSLADHVSEESKAHVKAFLHKKTLPQLNSKALNGSHFKVEGPVTGGNLCVLSSLCGTPYRMNGRGHIVLLEDISEPAYKIHRMLTQLLMSGSLDGCIAIGLGEFSGCNVPNEAQWTLLDAITDALGTLDCPIFHGLPFGHGHRNDPWKYGSVLTFGSN